MSKIFELYGYPLDRWDSKAVQNSKRAWCPFMDAECDGGGNRYLSALNVKKLPRLKNYFADKDVVQAGVCSLKLNNADQPWIVCPRRLLSLRGRRHSAHQSHVRQQLINHSALEKGKPYRVWSEVKMKIETKTGNNDVNLFDYTFDYIIAGAARKKLSEVADIIGKSPNAAQKIAERNAYTLALRGDDIWVEDFPADPIVIVEIMTSSTSGGDKNKRTQIAMACEDALIDPANHNAPGINYRQVWARMVSQLIVKSQVGMAWKGQTFWLIQDVLADYISSTTALNLPRYASECADEVNILSFGYGKLNKKTLKSPVKLSDSVLYAGPIMGKSAKSNSKGFIEIVKISSPPDKNHLWRSLFQKSPCGNISWK